ncbi:MAG: hypothetical protein CFE41_17720 [Burkholderiales bacterium PBB2]|nr:MAG: hypothetical protein CFE41_17720 [Burkholderiales bacterium PBB2]
MHAETPEAGEIDDIFRCLVPADLLTFLGRERVTAQFDRLDSVAAARLQVAFDVRADDHATMLARRREVQVLVNERRVGIDAWLTPTVPMLPQLTAAFRSVADVADWNRRATRNTRPGNLFGQCGISLPIQHLGAVLPVGLQLCSAPGEDAALLSVACAIEEVLGQPLSPMLDSSFWRVDGWPPRAYDSSPRWKKPLDAQSLKHWRSQPSTASHLLFSTTGDGFGSIAAIRAPTASVSNRCVTVVGARLPGSVQTADKCHRQQKEPMN